MTDAPVKPRRTIWLGTGLAAAALAIAAAVWLSNGGTGSASECPVREDAAAAIDAVARGELAALMATPEGRAFSSLAFQDEEGNPVSLADFAGKKLLVNFWATWCIPCREEMPDLDAVAARYEGEDFALVTVSLDAGGDGPDKARAFFDEYGLDSLVLYADPSLGVFERLRNEAVTLGLPATLLLDETGCELAVLQGPAAWSSADGNRVIETLIGLEPA